MDVITKSGEICTSRTELQSSAVLRQPPSQQPEPKAMDDNAAVNQEAAQIIKLQQKLALAEQEVKDMANKLTKMSEAVDQAREEFMAKENKLIGRMKELEKNLDAYSERAKCELEEQRMKMELEKLRELETLRSKFDLEREQHRLERQKDAALIAKLILALEPKRGECPRFDTEKLVETSEGGNSPTYPSESGKSPSVKTGKKRNTNVCACSLLSKNQVFTPNFAHITALCCPKLFISGTIEIKECFDSVCVQTFSY